MTVLPVIGRELRTQCRLAFTYNLRVIGAATVMVVCLVYLLSYPALRPRGEEMFARLNIALFISIWVLAPMLCADCISRERREGTVGLLFLTPLRAQDVVLAKGLVHGVRALSLLLAVLPVMTIPFFLGGVSWSDAAMAVLMNCSAMCWALAAGLLASSFCKTWLRAQLLAFSLAAGFAAVFLFAVGGNAAWFFGRALILPYYTDNPYDQTLLAGFMVATDAQGWWGQMMGRIPARAHLSWLLANGRVLAMSCVVLFVCIEIAARNLKRFWRELPPSARRVWLEKKLFTPVVMVSLLRGWMRHKLEHNPIGWLEQRTWHGRLVMWSWFAVMIAVYSAALRANNVGRTMNTLNHYMAWVLLGVIAATAAGSFQRERETGVLELLLVSPLSANEIIMGRLRGLWGQFLPAFATMMLIWVYISGVFSGQRLPSELIGFLCTSFLTLPVIGLYFSLRRANFISAFLFTVFAGVAAPYGARILAMTVFRLVLQWGGFYRPDVPRQTGEDLFSTLFYVVFYAVLRFVSQSSFVNLAQIGLAVSLGRRLHRDLERRHFTITRARS